MTSQQLSAIFSAKKILRKELKRKLKAITAVDRVSESEVVANIVTGHSKYKNAENICVYVSMREEVCTQSVIESVLQDKKNLFVPYFNKDDMFMVQIKDFEDYSSLPLDTYGVRQPTDYETRYHAIDTRGLDLMVCPGLGFTTQGLRIGRGKGYYDNYLAKYERVWNAVPYTIALAFSVQILSEIPITESDRVLDEIISPLSELLYC